MRNTSDHQSEESDSKTQITTQLLIQGGLSRTAACQHAVSLFGNMIDTQRKYCDNLMSLGQVVSLYLIGMDEKNN